MKNYILIAICAASFAACDKTENLTQLPGNDLEGKWQEIEPRDIAQFEGSTYAMLDIKPDNSFMLTYRYWTDIAIQGDPCRMYDEFYAKGSYTIDRDVIRLNGCYSDQAHRDCAAKCDGTMEFTGAYPFMMINDTLILDPEKNEIERRIMVRSF